MLSDKGTRQAGYVQISFARRQRHERGGGIPSFSCHLCSKSLGLPVISHSPSIALEGGSLPRNRPESRASDHSLTGDHRALRYLLWRVMTSTMVWPCVGGVELRVLAADDVARRAWLAHLIIPLTTTDND